MDELHMGPIMDKREGLERHCETVLPNSKCPYLVMGCLGCTRSARLPMSWAEAIMRPPPVMTPDELNAAIARIQQIGTVTIRLSKTD